MNKIKIYVPNISNTSIGGGWTFLRNFQKAMSLIEGVEIVGPEEDFDILFAFAPNTIDGETIQRVKKAGKPFVLRMDGVPEDSRNSGRGTGRMISHASQADYIIYQSFFIQNTLGKILKENRVKARSTVIHNGVDTNVFTPEGGKINFPGKIKIFHMNYRKDPNKRYEEVVHMYRNLWTHRKDVCLILFGRYPTEWNKYNYGFFNGEQFKVFPATDDTFFKATVMRSCDLMFYPSYADPAPNAALEAMASGLPVIHSPYGGTKEYIDHEGLQIVGQNYNEMIDMMEHNLEELRERMRHQGLQFSLPIMGAKYLKAFMRALDSGEGKVATEIGGEKQ